MRLCLWRACALALAFALGGCGEGVKHPEAMPELERALDATAEPGVEDVARVDGRALSSRALQALWTQRPELDRAGALDALIEQELLAREGVARALVSPELDDGRTRGLSRALIEREIMSKSDDVSEAVVQVFREKETRKLTRPSGLVASHLLVRTTSDPQKQIPLTSGQREQMSGALTRARALLPARPDPSDLREVARELEGDGSLGDGLTTHVDARMTFTRSNQAGELPEGWVQLVPPFVAASEEAADTGRLGEVVGPVETPFGMHLIVVHEALDAPELDAARIESRARSAAKNAELGVVFEKFVAGLREESSWAVYPEALLEDAAGGS